MKISTVFRRFLIPKFVVSLVYYMRFGSFVSLSAEVELSPLIRIGRGTKISSYCKIKALGGPGDIGSNVSIATGCFIGASKGGVEIGDHTLVGPNCTILSSNYITTDLDTPFEQQGHTSKGTRIGRNVLIGANSVILDGSTIGDGVIISAGSVVSGRVKSNMIVQGNPAVPIFERRA